MSESKHDESGKRVKNIAAVLYLLMMVFVVGGSYLNQQGLFDGFASRATGSDSGN